MKTRLLVCLLVMPLAAAAHIFPDHAEPKAGATVKASPKVVKIWFTDDVAPGPVTVVRVFDAKGREVDRRDTKHDAGDPTLISVSVPVLGQGEYKVVWRALCTEGHVTHGSFAFRVSG